MSASRVESAEGMDVDDAGVALPTPEWMEAARKAADTDGILENASAKRQKVCNPCNTLTALHLQTLHKNAHKKRDRRARTRRPGVMWGAADPLVTYGLPRVGDGTAL